MFTMNPPSRDTGLEKETRCECGQLIAKVRGHGLELKCKRCKRIVVIPFAAIEGWSEGIGPTVKPVS